MNLTDGAAWQTTFEAFMGRFGRFFKRGESRDSAARYVRGLLADVKRKNCWQLAEKMGKAQYEVRHWHSWYRHMTLSLIAHTWLTLLRHDDAQKKSATAALLAAAQPGGAGLLTQYLLSNASV